MKKVNIDELKVAASQWVVFTFEVEVWETWAGNIGKAGGRTVAHVRETITREIYDSG